MKRTGKPRKWIGKKTRAWRNCVVRLKKKFERIGVTSCELGYEGCWRDESLGFAHGRKRRWLLEDELERFVIVACNPCHDLLEVKPAEEMLAIVQSVISERGWMEEDAAVRQANSSPCARVVNQNNSSQATHESKTSTLTPDGNDLAKII